MKVSNHVSSLPVQNQVPPGASLGLEKSGEATDNDAFTPTAPNEDSEQQCAMKRLRQTLGSVAKTDGRVAEAYILRDDNSLQGFDGTQRGWDRFVDTMNAGVKNVEKGLPSHIRSVYTMGHGGPDGIYPQRFPKNDTTHSYLYENDQHEIEVGSHGGKALLKDLHWDKLNLEEFHVMGCGTANTYDGKNITEALGQTLRTRAIGNKEIYWFHTESMKSSPFLEPLNAPRVFNYGPPRPYPGPSPRP